MSNDRFCADKRRQDKSMYTVNYDIDLSFRDVLAIVFRRNKNCLNCSGKVIRKTEKIDLGEGWDVDRQGLNFDVSWAHKYRIKVKYVCKSCDQTFLPREFW